MILLVFQIISLYFEHHGLKIEYSIKRDEAITHVVTL